MKVKPFPFISWIKKYNKKDFLSDSIAWTLLAIILLPKSMAYAVIAWLPPIYWIYTNLFSPAIASLWWSSKYLSTWAAAVISFLVFTSVTKFAEPLSPEFIQIAIMLSLMVWLIQLLLWCFKLWTIMSFISHSVIKWFTNAAAIIIIFSQIKDILWLKIGQSDSLIHTIIELVWKISHINLWTIWIWIFSIFFILISKKIHKLFPWALIIIVLFTYLTQKYWLNINHKIQIIWNIPAWLPIPWFPFVNIQTIIDLIPISLIIAIIGFTEAYSVSKMMATKTKEKVNVNQELIWQWLANIVTWFFKWFPVSWSFSWTAVNYSAWAKTWISNVIASFIMIIFLLFFTKYLYFLPKSVLAAIVIVAVSSLINFKELLEINKLSKKDWVVAFTTFGLALFMKPDYAIFLWVLLSLILFLYQTARPKIVLLWRNKDINRFVDSSQYEIDICPQIAIIRPEMSLYFANVENIFERTKELLTKNEQVKFLLIESTSINDIDGTAMHELIEFVEDLEKDWIDIYFVNLKSSIYKNFEKNWLLQIIWKGRFITGKHNILNKLFCNIDKKYCKKCKLNAFEECTEFKK